MPARDVALVAHGGCGTVLDHRRTCRGLVRCESVRPGQRDGAELLGANPVKVGVERGRGAGCGLATEDVCGGLGGATLRGDAVARVGHGGCGQDRGVAGGWLGPDGAAGQGAGGGGDWLCEHTRRDGEDEVHALNRIGLVPAEGLWEGLVGEPEFPPAGECSVIDRRPIEDSKK